MRDPEETASGQTTAPADLEQSSLRWPPRFGKAIVHVDIDVERLTYEIIPEVPNGCAESFEDALARGLDDDGPVGRLLRQLAPDQLLREDGLFRTPGFADRVDRLRKSW